MRKQASLILLLACFFAMAATTLRADEPKTTVDYARDVRPLLKERCFACHGALKQQASLRVDTAAAMKSGGDNGPAIDPGKPQSSRLIERITSADPNVRMPPEGKPLTAEQIAILTRWIAAGASAPKDDAPEADPRTHWSFRPIERPSIPVVKNAAWTRNPIDAFLAAEHEKRGLVPNGDAAPHRLLRRVSLDLVGLPPSRRELHEFLADVEARGIDVAYESAVDRLLASPQYGERWGRHWMDVWRYSDWYGRRSVNDVRNSYAQIWRWRDWIVRSLNDDKGYDRMLVEMLAADEVCPEDDEAVVATGYIVRNWYSLNYHQWMKDLVEHTGKAFLGLRLNCSHCHDHKYDPISHEDYFRFRAFFEPLELRHDRVPGEDDPGPFKKYIYASSTAPMKSGMIRVFDEKPDAQTLFYTQGDSRNVVEGRIIPPGTPAFLGGRPFDGKAVDLPVAAWYPGLKPFIQNEERAKRQAALTAAETALVALRQQADAPPTALAAGEARIAAANADLECVNARIAADVATLMTKSADAPQLALAAANAERQLAWKSARAAVAEDERAVAAAEALPTTDAKRDESIANARKKLAASQTAEGKAKEALAKTDSTYSPLSPTYPRQSSGRRTQLALWMIDRGNPLTARVAVNHIWMRHFGKPLVDSIVDFGRSGKAPSHPELLDWLACELIADSSNAPAANPQSAIHNPQSWTQKRLHRLIVTSSAYRMSVAAGNADALAADPSNRWYWRAESRRVEAEVVRDSILAASGQLDPMFGGPEKDAAQMEASRRRSLYFHIHVEDGGTNPFLALFDAPDPGECYRRSETIMPQQALVMTNSPTTLHRGRQLSALLANEVEREADESGRDARFIAAAFEQMLTRHPSSEESRACTEFLARQRALLVSAESAKTAAVNGVVAPSADPSQRARESLVRALLSHSEFITTP